MTSNWYNIKIRKGKETVFRGTAKTWRGIIRLLAEKHYGSFEDMVAHIFREDWVYMMTGKKIGDMDTDERLDLTEKLEKTKKKIKRSIKDHQEDETVQ